MSVDPVSETDRQDIQASLNGDGEAYARLIKRYQNRIAAQMWRFTREPDQVEELVQDVFVEAYLSLGGFKGRAPFLHWLRRIATRTGYKYWKEQSLARQRRVDLSAVDLAALEAPQTIEPFEAAEMIYQVLALLPAPDRLVLTLMYFEECDTNEIAQRTGWSRSLVKVRAYRARKKLKVLLEKQSD